MELETLPSNGGSEVTSVETVSAPADASIRGALDRAFDGIDQPEREEGPSRSPDGKFAAKEAAAPEVAAQPEAQPEDTAPAAPQIAPPTRFSKAAQDEWNKTPEPVRAETERAINELTNGLEQYRQRFEPLKQFDDMARSGGTTLERALSTYVETENTLRRDPVQGFAAICQNMGVDPVKIGEALAGMAPRGGDAPEVAALKNEIAALRQEIGGVSKSMTERDIMVQVNEFAAKSPRFEELAPTIEKALSSGFANSLPEAYALAERLNPAPAAPAPQAPIVPKALAPDQTRKASLSITGSSPSGSNPVRKQAGSPREALDSAFAQYGL